MTAFDQAFQIVVGEEGGFDNDPRDRGNWTTGVIGSGVLKGTKYGISAAAYPTLDIQNLTLDQAKAIYKADYWDKMLGDLLPAPIALYGFDGVVNSGARAASRWLQAAAGVTTDGLVGKATLAAVTSAYAADPAEFTGKVLGSRIIYMSDTAVWGTYRGGWTTRVCALPVRALAIAA